MEDDGRVSKSSVNGRELQRKRGVRIAGAVGILILVVVFILPLFVHADTFRPTLEQKISAALGRQVTLGHLSFSLFSGSLVARNVAIADDPAFSAAPFFQAKSLHIGVSVAGWKPSAWSRDQRSSSLRDRHNQRSIPSREDEIAAEAAGRWKRIGDGAKVRAGQTGKSILTKWLMV
jgi:hypothetical protein